VLRYDLPVGLEPVAVAERSDSEVWVVNQLSDDVSIVNLNTRHVRGTLRVGDEPSDVVFANGNAYVSVSQYDQVRVYDAGTLALVATIPIASRMPRALGRDANGPKVYVAGRQAGNRTTAVAEAEAGGGSGARNRCRFVPNQSGDRVGTRVGLIAPNGTVRLGDLNPHINYTGTPGSAAERDSAIGIPTGAAWSADGQRLYVTSLAS